MQTAVNGRQLVWEGMERLLVPDRYMPHGQCYLWQTPLVWLQAVSDGLIALSYFSISLLLLYFVRERPHLPFQRIFILFGAFILACGTTHLFSVWTLWYPVYWLSTAVKAAAAIVSVYTAAELYPLLPRALALSSPARSARLNSELSDQIREREEVERKILELNRDLERRVHQRTTDLAVANRQLVEEVAEREKAESRLQDLNAQLADRVHELEIRTEEMIRLGEMSDFLQACSTLSEAEKVIGNLLSILFPGSSGAIFLIEDSYRQLESLSYWGTIATHLDFQSHECWALRRGCPHQVESNLPNLYCQHLHRDNCRVTLCLPMMAQGETLGLLHLNFEDPRDLTPGRRRLAETASKQIAVALANLQLRESLQDLSFSDPLTGLYNRRYLEISLTRELHRLDREGGSLGLIVLDLDHFKRINDDFGHETGDKVLKAIGTYLKANTRQSDIAFRYGGEEFILALVDSPFTSTCERAETLRRGMRELDLSWERPELSFLTASFGVASFPEHGTTFDELFRVADEGVYLAKQSGRDRVGRAA